jgi:hypothetical protein
LESFAASQQRAHGYHQDIEQRMFLRPFNTRVFSGLKMLDDRRVDHVSHVDAPRQ